MSKTAFVTGANGFIGLNLVAQLTAGDWDVTALHRPSSDLTYLRRFPVRAVVGSIDDLAGLESATPRDVDAVFHCAADVSFWRRNAARQTRTNVEGTRNVVEAALRRGAKKFVHTSSSIVYGLGNPGCDETAPYPGRGSQFNYMRTKTLAEDEVRNGIARGLDAVLLNPTNVIGRYDRKNWSQLFRLTVEGKLSRVPPGRSTFCHGTEVARAHLAAVACGRSGENYLLGGPDATYLEIVKMIGDLTGHPVDPVPLPAGVMRVAAKAFDWTSMLTGKEPRMTPDAAALLSADTTCRSDKAMRELGYRSPPLHEILEDCYRWLVEEGLVDAWRGKKRRAPS